MAHKYFKTISELIDFYMSMSVNAFYSPALTHGINGMMTHAYELGYKHATEEEQPNPAEFDSNYEQETSND